MKTLVLATLLVVAIAYVNGGKVYYDVKDSPYLFHKFIREYNRQYKDTEEVLIRYAAFVNNLENINRLNEQVPSATFDINLFADYTPEEMKKMNGLKVPPKPAARDYYPQYNEW